MRKAAVVGLLLGAIAILAAAAPLGRGAAPRAHIPPQGAYDARILRDVWGVPHIFGATDADAAYGLGYAHAEDDWTTFEEAILLSRGQLARRDGVDAAKFDYIGQLFRVRRFVDGKYGTEVPADVRAVAEAYAAGVTHYAALHPDKMPHLELPVTGKDVVAGFTLKAPFFYELQKHLEELMGHDTRQRPVSGWDEAAAPPIENPYTGGRPIGSNAFAAAPHRTSDGATRLYINSHQPWDGQVAWYEAHVVSGEGWNMFGGTFPGGAVIFAGHDENKGWAHTVNRPDLVDIYALEMNPANPNQYRFDGAWRDLEVDHARITVRLWGPFRWTVKREILWSTHGPALRTPHGVYALSFAGLGGVGALEQWFRMNKARDLDEFRAAMALQGIPSFNTVYADRAGNIYYAYNGKFPDRNPAYDWRQYLPGDRPDALWRGFLPFDRVPQILNPPSGFLQSCNNSPFHTTDGPGNPDPADFPAWMGIETTMNNRALRALELYGAENPITPGAFERLKYDTAYSVRSDVHARWREITALPDPEEPRLREALELLRGWNLRMDADNRAAALASLACEPKMMSELDDPVDPDPRGRLERAVAFLERHFGRIDPAWGEHMRLVRGTVDLPLSGNTDCLRVVRGPVGDDGRVRANYGDCHIMLVEWDRGGAVRSRSVHQYGSATLDPDSPHHADQAPLFASHQMKPVWLREADIRKHLKREYRPGDFTGPWHRAR